MAPVQATAREKDGLARLALDRLPAAVLLVLPSGSVSYANERAAVILNRARDAMVGLDISDLFHLAPAALDALVHSQDLERRIQVDATLPSGREILVGLTAGRLGEVASDQLQAIVFQDVSHLDMLRREHDRLVQLAAVGDVLPALLHELKNPLAAVATSVEVLMEELEDESARTMLHAVLGEVRRMKLTFDGVGAVGRPLRTTAFHAIDLACEEAFAVLEPRAASAGIIMRSDVAVLPLLPLDPAVMRGLVFNLVTNAIHASSAWGTVCMHVRLVERASVLELQVIDNGAGMSAETLARCRDLFFTTKAHGSGVGLALCRNAVEGAGGTLDIASIPGTGTRVTVTLPVRRDGGATRE